MAKCGAKKRAGGSCNSPAMPNGRCRLHGGATPETNQNAVTHGFYSNCYTDEEKANLHLSKIGSLEDEIKLARTRLARAALHNEGDEYYRPELVEKWANTVGRLEKQHAEITAQIPEDADEQSPIGITIEVVDGRKPSS